MTDFMRALLVQLIYPRDQRAKGAQFQLTCNLCQESHKTQVWLCFFVLSFLSTSVCSAYESVEDLKTCVDGVKQTIEKSDAQLYAPSTNDIKDLMDLWLSATDSAAKGLNITLLDCEMMAIKCCMAELIMVLDEEHVENEFVHCIIDYDQTLFPEDKPDGCPPCEAYSVRNVTVFLDRLNHLLEQRASGQHNT